MYIFIMINIFKNFEINIIHYNIKYCQVSLRLRISVFQVRHETRVYRYAFITDGGCSREQTGEVKNSNGIGLALVIDGYCVAVSHYQSERVVLVHYSDLSLTFYFFFISEWKLWSTDSTSLHFRQTMFKTSTVNKGTASHKH